MIGWSSAMRFLMDDVRSFQEMCGSVSPESPQINPPEKLIRLRAKLILEECAETLFGMFKYDGDAGELKQEISNACDEIDKLEVRFDIEAVADGLADLIYVVVGAALSFGIPLERVWSEVQRANMDKLNGPKRADGKQLKPQGWIPPRIHEAIFGEAT